jgi:hypothetical protein
MTWAMIKDKRKMGTILDEIDEEIYARNEAEDEIREKLVQSKLGTAPATGEPIVERPEPPKPPDHSGAE